MHSQTQTRNDFWRHYKGLNKGQYVDFKKLQYVNEFDVEKLAEWTNGPYDFNTICGHLTDDKKEKYVNTVTIDQLAKFTTDSYDFNTICGHLTVERRKQYVKLVTVDTLVALTTDFYAVDRICGHLTVDQKEQYVKLVTVGKLVTLTTHAYDFNTICGHLTVDQKEQYVQKLKEEKPEMFESFRSYDHQMKYLGSVQQELVQPVLEQEPVLEQRLQNRNAAEIFHFLPIFIEMFYELLCKGYNSFVNLISGNNDHNQNQR